MIRLTNLPDMIKSWLIDYYDEFPFARRIDYLEFNFQSSGFEILRKIQTEFRRISRFVNS